MKKEYKKDSRAKTFDYILNFYSRFIFFKWISAILLLFFLSLCFIWNTLFSSIQYLFFDTLSSYYIYSFLLYFTKIFLGFFHFTVLNIVTWSHKLWKQSKINWETMRWRKQSEWRRMKYFVCDIKWKHMLKRTGIKINLFKNPLLID